MNYVSNTTITHSENQEQCWNRDTNLCVDVKTFLRSDRIAKPGKDYVGVLRLDVPSEDLGFDDRHFSFIEIIPSTPGTRNPRIYDGKYITVTLQKDGTYRVNLKPIKMGQDFSVDGYAIGVCNEIREALKGLI